MTDYRHVAAGGMVLGFIFLCFLVAFSLFGFQHAETPATQINNATVVNNYYCNVTEPINGTITVYGDHTESTVITETQTPSPTPALWNDTRRESVDLPKDVIGSNCCKHCTPTPTPTGTPVHEFPCPLRSGC